MNLKQIFIPARQLHSHLPQLESHSQKELLMILRETRLFFFNLKNVLINVDKNQHIIALSENEILVQGLCTGSKYVQIFLLIYIYLYAIIILDISIIVTALP